MITLLIWTIWTPMSSVPKKADKLNLSLSLPLSLCEYIKDFSSEMHSKLYLYWVYRYFPRSQWVNCTGIKCSSWWIGAKLTVYSSVQSMEYCLICTVHLKCPTLYNSCLFIFMSTCIEMGNVALVSINGTTCVVPYLQVRSMQLIWRSGTHSWNLRVPVLQMNCSDWTEWQGTGRVVPVMATWMTCPIQLAELC